jgi:hypothetical protein
MELPRATECRRTNRPLISQQGVAAWALLNALTQPASASSARWFASLFDQRDRIPRLRFIQE